MSAPLDGFSLHPIPADQLLELARHLDRLVRLQRDGWPEFAGKCRDRAEALRDEWRRTRQARPDGGTARRRPTIGRAAP